MINSPILLTFYFLLLGSSFALSQSKIYYNKNNEITIEELATHYRIANLNIKEKKFIGIVKEISMDSTWQFTITYDSSGVKNGAFNFIKDGILINGIFTNDKPNTNFELTATGKSATTIVLPERSK